MIPDLATDECPVSLIGPDIRRVVRTIENHRYINEFGGALLFGPDIATWPAWYADAVQIIQEEICRETNITSREIRNGRNK